MAVCAICAAGALAAPAAGAPAARGSSGGPAVFEASRAGGDVGHAGNMEPSDPHHQNVPSPEEVLSHFLANGWTKSTLSNIPAVEIASFAAKIEEAVICACGCPRQSIYDCNCRTAAELRGRVLDEMARLGRSAFDLTTEDGRSGASREILSALANEAGGVSGGGQNTSTLLFVMVLLGLVVVVVVARRRGARRSDPPA